ncbi:hypothetical protein GQ457_03G010880 [Hibiscus cannabinus]
MCLLEMEALRAQITLLSRIRDIEATQLELADAIKDIITETKTTISTLETDLDEIKAHVNMIQLAVGNSTTLDRGQRVRVPEPLRFEGNRDVKELENFLFDIEQYLRAIHATSEEDKVSKVSMYLSEDAKL